MRMLFFVLLAALFFLTPAIAVHEDVPPVLRFAPANVFSLTVQYDGETPDIDYHEYTMDSQTGTVCDLSRPVDTRLCGIDLAAFAARFQSLYAVKYVASLPSSVNWWTWDWETGKPLAYTKIPLVVDIRLYDCASDRASRLWLACSFVPDDPTLGVCMIRNQVDHYNYVLVDASELGALIGITP